MLKLHLTVLILWAVMGFHLKEITGNAGTFVLDSPNGLACEENKSIWTQEDFSDRAILPWQDQCKCMELAKSHLHCIIVGHMLAQSIVSIAACAFDTNCMKATQSQLQMPPHVKLQQHSNTSLD